MPVCKMPWQINLWQANFISIYLECLSNKNLSFNFFFRPKKFCSQSVYNLSMTSTKFIKLHTGLQANKDHLPLMSQKTLIFSYPSPHTWNPKFWMKDTPLPLYAQFISFSFHHSLFINTLNSTEHNGVWLLKTIWQLKHSGEYTIFYSHILLINILPYTIISGKLQGVKNQISWYSGYICVLLGL